MMCLANDGVERKVRTRNTDDRAGSTKSECVRCGVFRKKQISKTQEGEKSGGVQKAHSPETADPLETAISAATAGAPGPLRTRKIQRVSCPVQRPTGKRNGATIIGLSLGRCLPF